MSAKIIPTAFVVNAFAKTSMVRQAHHEAVDAKGFWHGTLQPEHRRQLMTAHLYCWAPSLDLDPANDDFRERVHALHRLPDPPRSPRLVTFVEDLLSRYGDVTETCDTVWGDGPLVGNILGEFINMSLIWSRYAEAAPFVVKTAHKHGLHCYDPQTDKFFPVRVR